LSARGAISSASELQFHRLYIGSPHFKGKKKTIQVTYVTI